MRRFSSRHSAESRGCLTGMFALRSGVLPANQWFGGPRTRPRLLHGFLRVTASCTSNIPQNNIGNHLSHDEKSYKGFFRVFVKGPQDKALHKEV